MVTVMARSEATKQFRAPPFRDGPKDQTSDVQLRIGESRDSGFDAEPVIGPRFARTRWHRPGMTESGLVRGACHRACIRGPVGPPKERPMTEYDGGSLTYTAWNP